MHQLYRIILILFLFLDEVQAQQLINASFEDRQYTNPPPMTVGPDGWQSNNRDIQNTHEKPVNTFAIPHSGNFSAMLFTVSDSVSNNLVMGKLSQEIALHGHRPEYISLFTLLSDRYPDPPVVKLSITSGQRIIGTASYSFTSPDPNGYSEVHVPITYIDQGICDSMFITIQSSSGTGAETINNVIAVDDIQIHYYDSQLEAGELYPNPANQLQQLELFVATKETIEVSVLDMQGKSILQQSYVPTDTHFTLFFDYSSLAAGAYTYQVRSQHETIIRKALVIH